MTKFNKKIKVVLLLPLLLGSFFILFKYSKAYFSDSETVLGNSIQMGTWGATITPTPTEVPPGAPTTTPTETPTPTSTSTPTPTPVTELTDHPVISEIQTVGSAADDEFIELYNPTDSSVDISGWSIQYRGGAAATYGRKDFVTGQTIPAHGFFLIASAGYDDLASPEMLHSSFSLSNTGGTVFLVNNQITLTEGTDNGPTVVDKVAYGTGDNLRPEGSSFTPAPASNQSIERKALSGSTADSMTSGADITKGNGHDSNDNLDDFIPRVASQPQNSSSPTESP